MLEKHILYDYKVQISMKIHSHFQIKMQTIAQFIRKSEKIEKSRLTLHRCSFVITASLHAASSLSIQPSALSSPAP